MSLIPGKLYGPIEAPIIFPAYGWATSPYRVYYPVFPRIGIFSTDVAHKSMNSYDSRMIMFVGKHHIDLGPLTRLAGLEFWSVFYHISKNGRNNFIVFPFAHEEDWLIVK